MKDFSVAVLKLGNLNIEVLDLYTLFFRKDLSLFNHTHSFYEIHFIMDGWVELNVEGKSFRLEKNDALFLPKNYAHFSDGNSDDFRVLSICFDLTYAGNGVEKHTNEYGYFLKLFSNLLVTRFKFTDYDKSLLYNIIENVNKFTVYSVYKINTEATNLFLEVSKTLNGIANSENIEETTSIFGDQLSLRKNRVDYYIINNINDCKIEGLAEFLHLSVRQTSRFLKKSFLKTFKEILKETRLRYAEPLIKENKYTLKEISVKAGFKSYKDFLISYEEYYGKPPKVN